jgi:hypothetical protein
VEIFELDPAVFKRSAQADEHLLVVFYMGTIKNDARSLAEGRLIVDDVECIKIIIPGDKNNIIDRPASKEDKARFARQYMAFKAGKQGDEQLSGTRLTDWPFLSRGQVEEMHYLGIKTVEQLANTNDSLNFPGLQQFKQHAQSWLATTKDSALAAQQADRLQRQDAEIAELKAAVADQAQRIEKLLAQKQR